MKNILELLAPGWVGSIIGLIGVIAAAITFFLSRKRLILAYRFSGDRLLGQPGAELPPDITVQYQGRKIPRLTRSIIILWNDGEKTIRGSEIVASDPLRIDGGDDIEMLSTAILKVSRSVNSVQCVVDRNNALVTFDFLDPGDGAVIEILHTGEKRHLSLVGTVRGLPDGVKNLGKVISRRLTGRTLPFRISPRILGWVVVLIGIVGIICGLFIPLSTKPVTEPSMRVMISVSGALYSGIGGFLIWLLRRRYPRDLHIDEFE